MEGFEDIERCVNTFARGDYAGCADQCQTLFQRMGSSHLLIRLYFISLQRSGRTAVLDQIAEEIQALTKESPWDHGLLNVILGSADGAAVVVAAQGAEQLCQAHYYHGVRLLAQGRTDEAMEQFMSSVGIEARVMEGQFAAIEAKRLQEGGAAGTLEVAAQRVEGMLGEFVALYSQGNRRDALELARSAVEYARNALGETHSLYGKALSNLAAAYQGMEDFDQAETTYRAALKTLEAAVGRNDPNYASVQNNLASLLIQLEKFQEAEDLLDEALAFTEEVLGKEHPDYWRVYSGLGVLFISVRQFRKAERILKQVVNWNRSTHGEDHPSYAGSLGNLAGVYLEQGEYVQAKQLLQKALEIHRRDPGEGHPDCEHTASLLAAAEKLAGA